MRINVLTLFPEIVHGFFQSSIMAKALNKGLICYNVVNIRDYAFDKHRNCDDYPYGGGAGMVLKAEPVKLALESLDSRGHVVYPSPSGKIFNRHVAFQLSQQHELTFICGRYEGLDQRIIDLYVDAEYSIGDYVISSGEIASLVIIDALYRHVDGVISKESLAEESFENGLLEYPHYTRPEEFDGTTVPDVLLSGHHKNIEAWRLERRVEKTQKNRPDLYEKYLASREIE